MYVAAPGMRRQTRMEHICHALTDRQICSGTGQERMEFALPRCSRSGAEFTNESNELRNRKGKTVDG